jgi:hypothetical protein
VLLASDDTLTGFNRIFAFGVLTKTAIRAFAERIKEFMDTQVWLRKEGLSKGSGGRSFRSRRRLDADR